MEEQKKQGFELNFSFRPAGLIQKDHSERIRVCLCVTVCPCLCCAHFRPRTLLFFVRSCSSISSSIFRVLLPLPANRLRTMEMSLLPPWDVEWVGYGQEGEATDLPILSVCAHFYPKHREIKAKIKTSYLHLLFEGFGGDHKFYEPW